MLSGVELGAEMKGASLLNADESVMKLLNENYKEKLHNL